MQSHIAFSTCLLNQQPMQYLVAPVTLKSPPVVGGSCSNTFSINTYSTYSAIYMYILDFKSLEQAFAMVYSTYSVRRNFRCLVSPFTALVTPLYRKTYNGNK